MIYLILFFSLLIALITCFHKTDSSRGRVFIYKISSKIFVDNGIYGIGLGNFKSTYLPYQQEYFQSGEKDSSKEALLADNTYYLFNDYLQFILECGVSGIVVCVIFWLLIIRAFSSFYNQKKSTFEQLCFVILIPIIFAAVFNHMFEKVWVQIIFCLTFPGFLYTEFNTHKNSKLMCMASYAIFFLIFVFLHRDQIFLYKSYNRLEEAKTLASCGYSTESLSILDNINTDLKGTIEYNLTYGNLLFKTGQYSAAIPYLKRAFKNLPSSDLSVTIGLCYKNLKKYKAAEHYTRGALAMTPNRFVPREQLFSIYIIQHKTDLAKTVAAGILQLPVKVGSQKVAEIKSNAQNYITHLTKSQ